MSSGINFFKTQNIVTIQIWFDVSNTIPILSGNCYRCIYICCLPRYWNGSKSLHRHSKFQSKFNEIFENIFRGLCISYKNALFLLDKKFNNYCLKGEFVWCWAGLAQRLVSSHLPATVGSQDYKASHGIDKLQRQLNERTAEISRMRDQMSHQQRELEQVRSNFKSQDGIKESLDATAHDLVCK